MLPVDWQRRFEGLLRTDHALAPLTTWRIGGPAQLYVEPDDLEELSETVALLWRIGLPYRILGGGSNLLVADTGVRGAVISLRRLRGLSARGTEVEAEAGAPLRALVHFAASRGLGGAESLCGIPGQVGGAVFGNAGGRHGAIGELVTGLDLMAADGTISAVSPREGFFRYRRSDVGERVVVRIRLELSRSETASVRARSLEILRERRGSQPGWVGNAGCVFKNPPGESAGRLIDEAGCKGLRSGPVFVSLRHANFIENAGGGTAAEVERLIERVADRVRRIHGVELETEVRRWS
jgi:UDP-N-acetylmuramate dehydrogenase